MSIAMVNAVRKMSGDKIPVIDLSSYEQNNYCGYEERYSAQKDALARGFKDFLDTYERNRKHTLPAIENVIHYTVVTEFENICSVKGVDVVYKDMTIHMRFILDGVDERIEHKDVIGCNTISGKYNNDDLRIHCTKMEESDNEECWEYVIQFI